MLMLTQATIKVREVWIKFVFGPICVVQLEFSRPELSQSLSQRYVEV